MTYKKPLKAFMATTLMGFTANAMDTADGKRIGSYAIDALEAHETIETEDTDMKILVPFHAVKKAMYATMTADADRPDPYCEGGSDSDQVTITVIRGCNQDRPVSPPEVVTTFKVNKGERTPMPSGLLDGSLNPCGSGGNCAPTNRADHWVTESGDATFDRDNNYVWWITANEDSTIFGYCFKAS